MQDNNIIQEAIDCLKRLHKENAELKAENEKLRELLNHYQEEAEALRSYETYKIWLNNEYRKENERLKEELATYEASEIEIEDLKNKLNLLTTANNHLLKLYEYGQKEVATYKQLADKYLGCLQKIKEIAEELLEKGLEPQSVEHQLRLRGKRELASIIIDLITKAESEEV